MNRIQQALYRITAVTTIFLPTFFIIRHFARKYKMVETEWLTKSPLWTASGDYKTTLLSDKNIDPPPNLNLDKLIEKSRQFPIQFPVETVRCEYLKKHNVSADQLEANINSAYPIIHEQALLLCTTYLLYQKKCGNTEFYKDMSLLDFIDRLLSKRAVAFVDRSDQYLLIGGEKGAGNWETVGTPEERPPLILKDCLSYDEIKLSALLSVSSRSYFINDGDRRNFGKFDTEGEIERDGIIVGLIGARLEKENVMEYREIVKTKEQNVKENGYGEDSLQGKFLEFYGDDNAIYDRQIEKFKANPERYVDLGGGNYFDSLMFEKRIAISIDTLLIEANARAKEQKKTAFVHVVGLGLGVWSLCKEQDRLFMDVFAKRIEFLKDVLTDISDVRFAYIKHDMAGKYRDGDVFNGIKIHIENKNPQIKLAEEGKLLVVSFAWDGNALPGNEFWFGKSNLAASGDPAAASSSQIAELHNCHINEKVRASNLRVATLKGLVTFQDYQKLHKDD